MNINNTYYYNLIEYIDDCNKKMFNNSNIGDRETIIFIYINITANYKLYYLV